MATSHMTIRGAGPGSAAAAGAAGVLAREALPLPVLLYLIFLVLPVSAHAGPLLLTNLRLLLMVMILPVTFRLLGGAYGRLFITDALFAAHLVWMIFALAVNNPNVVIQNVGSAGVEFAGGYLLARGYIRTRASFAALCRALILIVCLSLPFAIFETLTGRPIVLEFLNKLPGLSTWAMVHIDKRMELERVQFTFAHPIHYGLFCSVAFSMAMVALKDDLSTARRIILGVVIAISGFLALSSGAMLAVALQFALILWSTIFARVTRRWLLLLGLFAVLYVLIDLLSNRPPIRVFMSYATFSAHNAYWRGIIFEWGMKSVWGHPWFGIGLNDWVRPWFMYSGSMDNFWLVMAVRYGIPGFLLLAVGYFWALFRIGWRDFTADIRLTHYRRAWIFTMAGLSFTLCTVHVWTSIYSFVFFFFGAGVWLIFAEPETGEKPAEEPGRPAWAFSRQAASIAPGGARADGPRYSRFPPKTRS